MYDVGIYHNIMCQVTVDVKGKLGDCSFGVTGE